MAKQRAWHFHSFMFSLVVAVGVLRSDLAEGSTLVVYNNNDAGAGSLRQALQDNGGLGGGNTVVFSNSVVGTIALNSALSITADVAIAGPGASVLTISGGTVDRVFNITGGAVTLSGLTIANGHTTGNGGGVFVGTSSPFTIQSCVFSNNSTANSGGALSCAPVATILNSTFVNNTAVTGGGGIYNYNALSISNCTFTGNVATSGVSGMGGAIFAFQSGGGNTELYACTIVSNTAAAGAGGVQRFNLGVFVRNCIIAHNSAPSNPDVASAFASQGYNLIGNAGTSTGWTGVGDQVGSSSSPIDPLVGPLQDNGGPTPTMALLAGSPAIDQAKSAGLAVDQRGRPRPYDNPTIPNATGGDGTDIGAVELSPTTHVVTNNNDNGAGSLRQAIFDARGPDGDTITFSSNVVGTIILTNGEFAFGNGLNINGPGANVLVVSGNNMSRVFHPTGGPVNISGLSVWNGRVVGTNEPVGQNGENVRGGGVLNEGNLTLTSCILSNNTALGGQGGSQDQSGLSGNGGNGFGGGVCNLGTLSLAQCTLIANAGIGGQGGPVTDGQFPGTGGQGWGGGLYTEGPVSLSRCTVSGNNGTAGTGPGGPGGGVGGGLYSTASLNLTNCTVASNTASGSSFDSGGGIANFGSLIIRNCTVAGNHATSDGGLTGGGDLGNTILAGNTGSPSPDTSGTVTSSDYNLLQNTNGCSFTGSTTHSITGVDPKLGPLQDNGGPTFTMALLAGSPALDRGKSFGVTTDQRGAPRPFNFGAVSGALPGDGSDIGAFEAGRPRLTIQALAGGAVLSWPSYYGGFSVISVTNLASTNWVSIPGIPLVMSSQYVVTNSPVSGRKFYRLVQP
jgi:predicted outer membrane repeat protein